MAETTFSLTDDNELLEFEMIPTGPRGLKGDPGDPGQPGDKGDPGDDGFSPTVTVQDITGGHRVVITDAQGSHTFDVMDGESGSVTVDDELSDSSTNPVQNRVVKAAIDQKAENSDLDDLYGDFNDLNDSVSLMSGQVYELNNSVNYMSRQIANKQTKPSADGTAGQVLGLDENLNPVWITPQGGGGSVTVDDALSGTSENPVQNKVVKNALDQKADSTTVNQLSETIVQLTGAVDDLSEEVDGLSDDVESASEAVEELTERMDSLSDTDCGETPHMVTKDADIKLLWNPDAVPPAPTVTDIEHSTLIRALKATLNVVDGHYECASSDASAENWWDANVLISLTGLTAGQTYHLVCDAVGFHKQETASLTTPHFVLTDTEGNTIVSAGTIDNNITSLSFTAPGTDVWMFIYPATDGYVGGQSIGRFNSIYINVGTDNTNIHQLPGGQVDPSTIEYEYSIISPTFDDLEHFTEGRSVKCTMSKVGDHYELKATDPTATNYWDANILYSFTGMEVGHSYHFVVDTVGFKRINSTAKLTTPVVLLLDGNGETLASPSGYLDDNVVVVPFTATTTDAMLFIYPSGGEALVPGESIGRFNGIYINDGADTSNKHTEIYSQSGSFVGEKIIRSVAEYALIMSTPACLVHEIQTMESALVSLEAELAAAKHPLKNMKVLVLGDSEWGNDRTNGPCDFLEEYSGMTVYNGAIGGTMLHGDRDAYGTTAPYKPFDGLNLIDAITSGTWTDQDANVDNVISYVKTDTLPMLKALDMNSIDIIILAYGTNDFENHTVTTMKAAIKTMVGKIQTAYPNITILLTTLMWRMFENMDGDTYTNANSETVKQFADGTIEGAREAHVSVVDTYGQMPLSQHTMDYYMDSDHVHLARKGNELLAQLVNGKLKAIKSTI